MDTQPAQPAETSISPTQLIRHLHGIVTRGPRDLDVIAAMRPLGYNDYKWAEGESLLAELIAADAPNPATVSAAQMWYEEAARTACHAFIGEPLLLARLGLASGHVDSN